LAANGNIWFTENSADKISARPAFAAVCGYCLFLIQHDARMNDKTGSALAATRGVAANLAKFGVIGRACKIVRAPLRSPRVAAK
jgi:hypothetical protein